MNKTEKYIIMKMAEAIKDWEKPYDNLDSTTRAKNAPMEEKYNFYKELLDDYYAGKLG